MAHYQTKIAYDGSNYQGFQKQAEGRTIQGSFENALKKIGWNEGSLLAAGRTDTGVHASGQVVSFKLNWSHSASDLQSAINANLPRDIAVLSIHEVRPDFHPRFDAIRRSYRYHIYCDKVRNPLRDRYAWRVWPAIDLERVQQAAKYLPGEYDFSKFGTPVNPGGSTIRRIFQADWSADGEFIYFQITGNAFLYHMVRRIVYYQALIGQGKTDPDSMLRKLSDDAGEMVQGLAPAKGLFLIDVTYETNSGETS